MTSNPLTRHISPYLQLCLPSSNNALRLFTDCSVWLNIVNHLEIVPWETSEDKASAVRPKELLSLALLERQSSETALRLLWKRKDRLSDICCIINSGTDDKYITSPGKNSDRWKLKRPLPEDVQKRAQLYLSYIRHFRINPYNHEANLWSVLSAALSGPFLLPNLHKLTLFNFCCYGKIKLLPFSPLLSPSIKVLEYGHGISITEDEISMIHTILHGYGASLNSVTFAGSYIGDPPIPIRHIIHPTENKFTFTLNEICPPLLNRLFNDILQPLSLSKTLTCFKFSIHQDTKFPQHVWKLYFDLEDKTQLRFEVLEELYLGWNDKYLELDKLFGRLDCPKLLGLYININDLSSTSWRPLFNSLNRYHKLEKLKISGRYRKEVVEDLNHTITTIFEIKDLEGILNQNKFNTLRIPRLPLRLLDLDIPWLQLTFEDVDLVLSSFQFLDTLLLSGINSKKLHPSVLPLIVNKYGMKLKDLCLPVDFVDQQYHYHYPHSQSQSQSHSNSLVDGDSNGKKLKIERLWFRNGSTLPENLEDQKKIATFLSNMFWSLQTQRQPCNTEIEVEEEDHSGAVNILDDLCKAFRQNNLN